MPFVPAEFADTIITDWLGFGPYLLATDIPISGFAVDDRRVVLGTSYSASRGPRGLMGEPGSFESGAEVNRVHDDYEVHNTESNRDFLEEFSRFGAKAKSFAGRTWQRT